MKRCPECRRDYYDDSLLYCLDDGSVLLEGPGSWSGGQTELLPAFGFIGEAGTIAINYPPSTPEVPANSIAVLPFANLSGDAGNDYLCDGISEELLNALSKIRGLRVAARTSAFSFKGKQANVAEIGAALSVASVLGGSVRIAGNRIRISVQLENAAEGFQLWSASYDRTLDDIFAVQDDIAESVVEELRARLAADASNEPSKNVENEVAEAFKGRAGEPEAQRLLLLGRYFLDRTNRKDAEKAIAHFQNAVEIDPEFALGWAELGHAYCVIAGKTWHPVDQSYANARTAIERALDLDPTLAEAFALLGRIQAAHDLDLGAAADSYAKALDISPGNPVAADGASILEVKLGNFDRAIELSRSVVDRDPLSAAVWHNLGFIYQTAGRLFEAEQAFRRALELSPNRLGTNAMLALAVGDQGRHEEALIRSFAEPDEFWRNWAQAFVHDAAGRADDADAVIQRLIDKYADGDAYQIAEIFAARGESERAFEWLERAIAERDPGITHAKVSPRFRPLHEDERWGPLLKRIGFPAD